MNYRDIWSATCVILVVLVSCLAQSSQGHSVYGLRKTILISNQDVPLISLNTRSLEERNQESDSQSEYNDRNVQPVSASRQRRNVIDNAKQSIKSTTEKLTWVKKNFRYLVLMVGSVFLLFFSCVAYRRLTRDSDDDNDDDVKVVVIGGPKERLSGTDTLTPDRTTNDTPKGTNETKRSDIKKTTPKKTTKPSAKVTKKRRKDKSSRTKGEMKSEETKNIKQRELNDMKDYSCNDSDDDYDSSDWEYQLLTRDSSDVIIDFINACARAEDENIVNKQRRFFDDILNQKKNPFPQIKLEARVMNEGIPLCFYTSFQQTRHLEAELNSCEPTTQFVDEIREHAELLLGKKQATHSTTSDCQYPTSNDMEVNKRLVISIHERCGQYYPKATTSTKLPITATTK